MQNTLDKKRIVRVQTVFLNNFLLLHSSLTKTLIINTPDFLHKIDYFHKVRVMNFTFSLVPFTIKITDIQWRI